MKIYNTLTRKVEEFEPINPSSPRSAGQVGMYTCGPTVYDFMHIGNLRTFVLSDLLLRTLKFNNYKVNAIQNITDIDDKIIKRAQEQKTTIEVIANEFTEVFIADVRALNIDLKKGKQPRATAYVELMVKYIAILIDKGFAYEKDGSVYFDITKFSDYGKLSRISLADLKTGTRSLSDNYTKDDIQDFVLWKAVVDDGTKRFESPWGLGRPGWHIECSVMSQLNLGDQFDIHVGGVDLIFPHHENEIAQSEAATGKKPFVNYWVHGAHLLVDGAKMSKSLDNFYTLKDIEEQGFDVLALRYLYLQTHYRQEMNFTWESLEAAQNALERLRNTVSAQVDQSRPAQAEVDGIVSAEFERHFKNAINDDLNLPQALAVVWEMLKSNILEEDKMATLFEMDKVLGLDLKNKQKKKEIEIPQEVQSLVREREALRKEKRYPQADQWRNKIRKLGFDIEDTEEGTTEVTKIGSR